MLDDEEEDGFDMFGIGNAVEFAADDTEDEDSGDAEADDEAEDSGVGSAVGSLLAGALGGVLGGAVGGMLANRRSASPEAYPTPNTSPYAPQQNPAYAPESPQQNQAYAPQDQKSADAVDKPYEVEATGKRLHVYEFDGRTHTYTQFKVKDKPMIIYELDQSTGGLRPVGLVD